MFLPFIGTRWSGGGSSSIEFGYPLFDLSFDIALYFQLKIQTSERRYVLPGIGVSVHQMGGYSGFGGGGYGIGAICNVMYFFTEDAGIMAGVKCEYVIGTTAAMVLIGSAALDLFFKIPKFDHNWGSPAPVNMR
jgi:hypothetical protein